MLMLKQDLACCGKECFKGRMAVFGCDRPKLELYRASCYAGQCERYGKVLHKQHAFD